MLRTHRHKTLYLLILGSILGCGTSEYEQLVNQRIAALRNPSAASAPDWQGFTSPSFGYTIEAPAEPKVSGDLNSGSETLTMPLASVSYQVQFIEGSDKTSLEEAAKAVQDLYVAQRFSAGPQENQNVNGLPCVRMNFTKADAEDTAIVQVFFLADKQQTCAMAVIGNDYSNDDALRFLESFAPR